MKGKKWVKDRGSDMWYMCNGGGYKRIDQLLTSEFGKNGWVNALYCHELKTLSVQIGKLCEHKVDNVTDELGGRDWDYASPKKRGEGFTVDIKFDEDKFDSMFVIVNSDIRDMGNTEKSKDKILKTNMENKELKISAENAVAAYNNADANGKKLLENLFGKALFESKGIMDKVKTFDDAVSVLGNDNQSVIDYYTIADATCTDDIIAFAKLRVITEALNEGWKPSFDGEECRYYPWLYIYTRKEFEELDDDEKEECHIVSRAHYYAYAFGGLVYANASYVSSKLYASYGSRLALKTRELAEYCGKQFIDIWTKYLFA